MCHRITIPTKGMMIGELERLVGPDDALRMVEDWEACGVDFGRDAFPNSIVPALVLEEDGTLGAASLVWGYPGIEPGKCIINTRLETAAEKPFWRSSFKKRRCLVLAQAFYEYHGIERAINPKTGKEARQLYRFSSSTKDLVLLAGIYKDGRFSLVTTEPVGAVKGIHDRMPLVLGVPEVRGWLSGELDDAALRGCEHASLDAEATLIVAPEQQTLF